MKKGGLPSFGKDWLALLGGRLVSFVRGAGDLFNSHGMSLTVVSIPCCWCCSCFSTGKKGELSEIYSNSVTPVRSFFPPLIADGLLLLIH
jgi:hypothetical protein